MQEACPVAESSVVDQIPPLSTLSLLKRRILIGLLLGLFFFAAALCPAAVDEPNECYVVIPWMGCCLVPLFLAAAWGALSIRPIAMRVPEAIGSATIIALAILWGINRASSLDTSPVLLLFMIAVVPVFAAMLPLWLFRKLRGWRICLASEEAMTHTARLQFSLRQMLGWMTFLAMALGLAAWIYPLPMPTEELLNSETWLSYGITLVIVLFLFTPLFICLAESLLAKEGRRKFIILSLHFAVLSPFLLLLTITFFETSQNPFLHLFVLLDNDISLEILFLEGTFIGVSFATFGVLRICGYRLVRIKKIAKSEKAKSKSIWAKIGYVLSLRFLHRPLTRIPLFPILFAALILAAAALGWPALVIQEANRSRALDHDQEVEWKKLGARNASVQHGQISYLDFSLRDKKPISQATLDKLQTAVFAEISTVSFAGASLADDQLGAIVPSKAFFSLDLKNTPITDAGLAHLRNMTSLTSLDLSGTAITDAGLKNLQGLTALSTLKLNGTIITNAGLENLKAISALRVLDLSKTKVTKAGLDKFK